MSVGILKFILQYIGKKSQNLFYPSSLPQTNLHSSTWHLSQVHVKDNLLYMYASGIYSKTFHIILEF